jgi:hypothetical protein
MEVSYTHTVACDQPVTTIIEAYLALHDWKCKGQESNGEKVWESRWFWQDAWLVDGVVSESQAYDLAVVKAQKAGFSIAKLDQYLMVNTTVCQTSAKV